MNSIFFPLTASSFPFEKTPIPSFKFQTTAILGGLRAKSSSDDISRRNVIAKIDRTLLIWCAQLSQLRSFNPFNTFPWWLMNFDSDFGNVKHFNESKFHTVHWPVEKVQAMRDVRVGSIEKHLDLIGNNVTQNSQRRIHSSSKLFEKNSGILSKGMKFNLLDILKNDTWTKVEEKK